MRWRFEKKLMIVCFVRIRSQEGGGFAAFRVYVLYASWTGCAALRLGGGF